MSLSLPALKYAYDALEPFIDEQTMKLHHSKHHQAYTDNMNKALSALQSTALKGNTVDQLLRKIAREDDAGKVDPEWGAVRMALRNHGGGYVNHDLFFANMSPAKLQIVADCSVSKQINADFGSLASFKTQFIDSASKVFGSGWVFLVYLPKTKKLQIVSTGNQDIPEFSKGLAGSDCVSILALDVWEHAYYLKYQNVRGGYLEGWWNVVDWNDVNGRFENASNM